jgi:ketosteroid isomerase-like protein
MTQQSTGLDFEALRRASEQRDAEALISLYAEDAEVRIVNRETPPSSPRVLGGRERIAEYLRDVYGRDIESRIEDEVVGEERVAFNEACRYPDGARVLTATTLEVRDDGTISRQVSVVVWDE